MRDVDTLELNLAFAADRDRVHHRADRRHAIGFRAALLKRDRLRRAGRQRLSPAGHFRGHVESADHIFFIWKTGARDELTSITIRILPCGTREFIHETLAIELMCRLSNPSTGPNRDMKLRRVVGESI